MIQELGSILDRVYEAKRRQGQAAETILFLVGDGIRPISNILSDERLKEEAEKRGIPADPTSRDFQEFRWRRFEYARYYSSNALPTFAHACIYQLVADGVCRDVITTNYDLSFDSIWNKYPQLGVAQNPVATDGEYHWEAYYSYGGRMRGRARYWKIHGSLSHVVFNPVSRTGNCSILRLPRFPISTNQPDLAAAFGGKCMAPYLGHEAGRYSRTPFTHPNSLKPQFEPFIDWTYGSKRHLFKREIDGAIRVLGKLEQIAAIVIVGFCGYFDAQDRTNPRNEELTPVLDAILDGAKVPVFMALHSEQYGRRANPKYHLVRRLDDQGRCFTYKTAEEWASLQFSPPNTRRFPFQTARREHAIWANYWYLTMQERDHV